MSRKLAEIFRELFAGLERSGGRYVVPKDAVADAHGKVLGRAWTAHAPITLELWEAHLSGKEITVRDEETDEPITGALGLGIVPIREDSTAVFGAIDVDVYPLDLVKLVARVRELGLPVVVCRTKSGGAHVYLFLRTPARAEVVRAKLMEWAVALGHPGVEVFPKQAMLSSYSDGSWINVPYVGGNRSTRYGLRPDATAMTVEEFVEAAREAAISPIELEDFEIPKDAEDEAFDEAPPCLQTLARSGFGDWGNNGLFNVAVYLKKRFPEDWTTRLDEYNEKYAGLGLGTRDVATIAKSVGRKNYFYKCKDQPICAVCNKGVCLKRKHGIGGDASDPGVLLGELVKVVTDPILWVLDVDGAQLELSTIELTDQRKFRNVVIEKLSKWPMVVKGPDWEKAIREKLAGAKVIEVPNDGTREGQFWEHLANFCTGRARARALDEILLGKAYTDPKVGRAYFRSTDFFAYLTARRFAGLTERDSWRWLRNRGAEHHERALKGKVVTFWSVPAFPEQTEEHAIPRAPAKPEM